MTATYEFTVIVSGLSVDDESHDDRLAEAGADDAMLFEQGGTTYATFYREAATPIQAFHSAVSQLSRAFPLCRVLDLDVDLVAIADIADRTGLSKEAVRLYATGKRGGGDFPTPMGVVGAGHSVWMWASVFSWLEQSGSVDLADEPRPVPADDVVALRAQIRRTVSRRSAEVAAACIRSAAQVGNI